MRNITQALEGTPRLSYLYITGMYEEQTRR